ncbi:TAXI family TRAP transporter solute-binding subunit [Leucobacter luti]|uniref:TAXI family TRAP transporter solute-binding subunit n=1 Tax=Leucobacter luti TaxID=340320 RepID=UPI001C691EE1|nr:TAXI family TRAP transporter solute-binding subunit [Leucobacter luti]QYM75276.1 TAXI family TRAP transporter solute-binding subunit [Leucobacter luti]
MRRSRIVSRGIATAVLGIIAAVALSACSAGGGAQQRQQYVIASGVTGGIYAGYGSELAKVLSRELGAHIEAVSTEGSLENLRLVGSGEALFGFAQSDTAADAVAGTGPFAEPLPIVAAARLYEEYVHVVVRADSDVAELGDLAGHNISLGAPNSGVAAASARILDEADVDVATITNPKLGLDDSLAALRDGTIEGFFWVGGLPTPGLQAFSQEVPIRLVSIEHQFVDQLNDRYGGVYRVAEFPAGLYGRDEVSVTMTVPNYLIVSADAPDDVVADALAAVFRTRAEIAASVPTAALLDRRLAIFTAPLELHPGAAAYYRNTKR